MSISPMTLIILGPIRRVNKDILGEINVLMNAMANKPLYHQVLPYFSSFKVVKEPTFGGLITQQSHSWEISLFRINRGHKANFILIMKHLYLLP